MSKGFETGWARITTDVDFYRGRVARVVDVDGDWITLEIDGDEVVFERDEVRPCPAPKVFPRA